MVEVGLAYGGDLPLDEPAEIMRFANRVPLQYQPKACAISESVYDTNWKSYELSQPKGSLPIGPLAIVVHLASVWVPFTSEAKEAVAHYDDLLKEMRLAIQECGRKLGSYLRARSKMPTASIKRLSIFQRYIPEVSASTGGHFGSRQRSRARSQSSFEKALPNFVNVAEANAPPQLPPGNGEFDSAASARRAEPKIRPSKMSSCRKHESEEKGRGQGETPGKTPGKKKAEQLVLPES